jgi:hypothetical protein
MNDDGSGGADPRASRLGSRISGVRISRADQSSRREPRFMRALSVCMAS